MAASFCLDLMEALDEKYIEDGIGYLVRTIFGVLIDRLDWIQRVGLTDDIQELMFVLEKVEIVVGALKGRAAGNKPPARSLLRLKDLLYDVEDMVDELDYLRLEEQITGVIWHEPEGMNGAARVHEKSRGDADIPISNGGKKRSKAWEHFEITGEENGKRKAKCIHCGTVIKYSPHTGTSVLHNHIRSDACRNKRLTTDLPPNHSSTADGTKIDALIVIGDSGSIKRRRMDESAEVTASNTHSWNKVEFSNRIQQITRHLEEISDIVSMARKLHGPEYVASSALDLHIRTSSLVEKKVYGRVAEKNYIIKLMTEDKSDGVTVLPIVGMGGVGKTTLAQLVYNDPTVVSHFDHRIWICVSNDFDEVKLSRQMLDFVSQETHEGLCSFAKLQEVLASRIKSKKVLLILDDVWLDTTDCRWDQLLALFKSDNANGNSILVTTRCLSTAYSIGTAKPIELGPLEKDDFWLLFKACAFGDENYNGNPTLRNIGRKIVENLQGNPLAAATVGGLLRTRQTNDHWSIVLKHRGWKSLELSGGIMPYLKRSYDQLPYHLKQCFICCSIFPPNYQFLGEELVHIWISEGFVKCDHSSKRLEEIGMDYLVALVSMGFLQQDPRKESSPGSQTCYAIHGLMHDFAREVSRTECATIDGLQCNDMLPTVRHLSILTDSGYSIDQHGNIFCNEKFEKKMLIVHASARKLRTLVLIGQYDCLFLKCLQDIIHVAQNLRVLQITAKSADLLCSLVNPIHLRYLRVDAAKKYGAMPQTLSKFAHLRVSNVANPTAPNGPRCLSKFFHLQMLDLASCTDPPIPNCVKDLASLRHLVVKEGVYFSIPSIGNMTSLQELDNFRVQDSGSFGIKQLRSMEELVRLGVSQLENVKSWEEAYEAGLRNKQHLEKLHLSWTGTSSCDEYDSCMISNGSDISTGTETECLPSQVLEGLEPHPNLKYLRISGYNGATSPTWLTASTSLQTLQIEDCGKLEIVPPLEQLPFLRMFSMMKVQNVTEISIPSLEELVLDEMPKLESCSCTSVRDLNDSLRVLKIKMCPALKIFPLFESSQKFRIDQKPWLPSLGELIIHQCPRLLVPHPLPPSTSVTNLSINKVSTLPRIEGSSSGTLTIEGSDDFDQSSDVMTILNENILAFYHLRLLRDLCIDGCRNLTAISFKGLKQLIYLNSLRISGCGKLFSSDVMPEHTHEDVIVADDDFLPSLKSLSIKSCGITGKWLSLMLRCVSVLGELFLEDCLQITHLLIGKEENIQSDLMDLSSENPDDTLASSAGLLHLPLNLIISLMKISIRECSYLANCGSKEGFSEFISLEKLTIWGCPRLVSSLVDIDGNDNQANGTWLLPKSLGDLEIRGDSPETLKPCFPGNCTFLRKLEVWFSPSLKSLQLQNCWLLEELIIRNCGSLAALEGLQFVDNLRSFEVFRSPSLLPCLEILSRQGLGPGLKRLKIDDPSVLTPSFCKQLTSLQILELENWEFATKFTDEQERGLQSLTSLQELELRDCDYLKYLPTGLHSLPSLKRLKISSCLGISRLPEKGLPPSLQELDISNCSKVLIGQCRMLATSKLRVTID